MPLQRRWREGAAASTTPSADPDDTDAAEAVAQRVLAASEKSCRELRERLQQRGFSAATAAAAVDRLAARGWADDLRLAEMLVRRGLASGHGRVRVIAELRARGATDAAIARAIDLLAGREMEAARTALRRLRHGQAASADGEAARRLSAALQRRGFGPAEIRAALRDPGDGETPTATHP